MTLCILPALAEEHALPAIRIEYDPDAVLSTDNAVPAQVTLTDATGSVTFDAALRLDVTSIDMIEALLPQQGMAIESDTLSFTLYNDGNDALRTKFVSALCARLIELSPIAIPVPAHEPAAVWLNGAYWGVYTKRESLVDAIARFEGLDDPTALRVADINGTAIAGAPDLRGAYQRALTLNLTTDRGLATLEGLFDTDSLINCLAINAYLGNHNFYGSLVFYQVGDGPWKCMIGNYAYAFTAAQANTVATVVDSGSAGQTYAPIQLITRGIIQTPSGRDLFLTKLGALYQALPTPVMQAAADAENDRITGALAQHMQRWSAAFIAAVDDELRYPVADEQDALLYQRYAVYRLRDKTLVRRPYYVFESARVEMQLTGDELARYFGVTVVELPEVPGDTWDEYRTAHP